MAPGDRTSRSGRRKCLISRSRIADVDHVTRRRAHGSCATAAPRPQHPPTEKESPRAAGELKEKKEGGIRLLHGAHCEAPADPCSTAVHRSLSTNRSASPTSRVARVVLRFSLTTVMRDLPCPWNCTSTGPPPRTSTPPERLPGQWVYRAPSRPPAQTPRDRSLRAGTASGVL